MAVAPFVTRGCRETVRGIVSRTLFSVLSLIHGDCFLKYDCLGCVIYKVYIKGDMRITGDDGTIWQEFYYHKEVNKEDKMIVVF